MDNFNASAIVASDLTVSDKIRALAAAGFARADIARLLGKRYQHVRNVLEADKVSRAGEVASGVAEPQRPFRQPAAPREVEDRGNGIYRLLVREDGSVVLPPAVREALGLQAGGGVIAKLQGDEFKLISGAAAWREIDEILAPYKWKGGPLASDELIAERRAEAARDQDD